MKTLATSREINKVPGAVHKQEKSSGIDWLGLLDHLDRCFFTLLKILAGAVFLVMIFSVFISMASRELGLTPFPWLEEASRYFVIWSVFISAAVMARRNEHISVDIFYANFPRGIRQIINICIAMLGMVLSGYFAYLGSGFTLTALRFGDMSLSGYLPVWAGYAAVPVGLGLTSLAYFLWFADVIRGKADRSENNSK